MSTRSIRAAAVALVMAFASHAAAQTTNQPTLQPYQQSPSIALSAHDTRWRVDESWNDDDVVYDFRADGSFTSPSGAVGRWVQTGNRVIMDWPSYGAIYIGTMVGDQITGTGYFDNGEALGTFVLTVER